MMASVVREIVAATVADYWRQISPWARTRRAKSDLAALRDEVRSNAGRMIVTGTHTGDVAAGPARWFFDATIHDATVTGPIHLGSYSLLVHSTTGAVIVDRAQEVSIIGNKVVDDGPAWPKPMVIAAGRVGSFDDASSAVCPKPAHEPCMADGCCPDHTAKVCPCIISRDEHGRPCFVDQDPFARKPNR